MTDIQCSARKLVDALDHGAARSPDPQLSIDEAYQIAASIREIRERRGEKAVGRKIGFTNARIWPEYGISDPIWGYMYDETVKRAGSTPAAEISKFLEPRIEPEICLGLSATVTPNMDDEALLACVEWAAHGFEIVHSLYPAWKMDAADAIAAHGMHGLYLLGDPHEISSSDRDNWLRQLTTFDVELVCNGETMDRGVGSNVLGGPLSALRHLTGLLADDPANPALAAGEIVTTGSLTGAFPVAPGEVWTSRISGLPLQGLSIRIE